MASSVSEFMANFQGGGLRPNRYNVIVSFPSAVNGTDGAAKKISFTCVAASIPSTNIGVVDVAYKGRFAKVPGDKVWDDWDITVNLDNDLLGRKVFETWHNAINGFESNITATPELVNPANAFATATVELLDRHDRILSKYQVEGMFPTVVGQIQLGYDQNDQVAQQAVTFAINGWSSENTD